MQNISFTSVEQINVRAAVAFTDKTDAVFREDTDISPVTIDDRLSYIPWGADNEMPYKILDLIEQDETLTTCQVFNAEVCYGSGLVYNTDNCSAEVKQKVEDFCLDNDISSYFLGVSQDFKYFGWTVSVIILDKKGENIVSLHIVPMFNKIGSKYINSLRRTNK